MYSLLGFLRESNQIELLSTETGRSRIMVIDLVCGYIHIQYNSYIKPTIPNPNYCLEVTHSCLMSPNKSIRGVIREIKFHVFSEVTVKG